MFKKVTLAILLVTLLLPTVAFAQERSFLPNCEKTMYQVGGEWIYAAEYENYK